MRTIILFGPPGAGKGTQAALMAERYGFNHISTGDVIREEIRSGSPLGEKFNSHISKGELVPDELVIEIIGNYLSKHASVAGVIFDGFPRTQAQAEAFDAMLAGHGIEVERMLMLSVPEQMLIDRMLLRGKTSGRCDDNDPAVIRNRIDVYESQTAVVASHYAKQDKLTEIDGVGDIEEIFARICNVLDKR